MFLKRQLSKTNSNTQQLDQENPCKDWSSSPFGAQLNTVEKGIQNSVVDCWDLHRFFLSLRIAVTAWPQFHGLAAQQHEIKPCPRVRRFDLNRSEGFAAKAIDTPLRLTGIIHLTYCKCVVSGVKELVKGTRANQLSTNKARSKKPLLEYGPSVYCNRPSEVYANRELEGCIAKKVLKAITCLSPFLVNIYSIILDSDCLKPCCVFSFALICFPHRRPGLKVWNQSINASSKPGSLLEVFEATFFTAKHIVFWLLNLRKELQVKNSNWLDKLSWANLWTQFRRLWMSLQVMMSPTEYTGYSPP